MNIRRLSTLHIYMVGILAGTGVFPFAGHAFFTDDLRKMHEQSIEQRDSQREQFRQDVLEKRKEFLNRWRDRRQGIKDKIRQDQEKIRAEFRTTRHPDEEMIASTSTSTEIVHESFGDEPRNDFFSSIQRQAADLARKISTLVKLFGE